MTSMLDVLDVLRPRLPGSWVSDAAFRRIRGAAARLPEGSAVFFVERGLARRSERVDFGLCYQYPAHRAVLDGNELLARRIPFLWLEVDGALVSDRSTPGVLLCLDDRLGRHACGRVVPPLSERRLLALGDAAHRVFLRGAPPRALRDSLRACFAALPAQGRLLHLSIMPSRNPPVVKLNVSLPKRALAGYLRKVGWSGSFASLEALWRRIAPSVRSAKIDLTLSPSTHPKLGLEIVAFNASLEGRRSVLAWLRRERLAGPRQSADLAAWHGATSTVLDGKRTPIELDFGMKVVLHAASKLDAKGYFHLYPRP